MELLVRRLLSIIVLLVAATAATAHPVDVVSRGEFVPPGELSVPGRVTLVDFQADWSPAGVVLSPELVALALRSREDIRLRQVRLEDWKAPILARYGVRCLPFVLVLDGRGRVVARGLEGYRRARALLEGRLSPDPASPAVLARRQAVPSRSG